MIFEPIGRTLVQWTEWILISHRKKRIKKEERQRKKHIVREWIESIIWALVVVILLQQFLFELYVIPTGSMIPTIEEGTRALVLKTVFGPEIIPGRYKSGNFSKLYRGEVIVLENPDPAIPRMSILKKIVHKIVFLLTLTKVNLDADKNGQPRERLLLKRAIGLPGERLKMTGGDVNILPRGERCWLTEEEIKIRHDLHYPVRRIFNLDTEQASSEEKTPEYLDMFARNPEKQINLISWRKNHLGWYIPDARFFYMGDNRDLSKDARVYGPVEYTRLTGKAVFSFWPLRKIGPIK